MPAVGTTLFNRNPVQKAIKAKDGKTYWIGPKKHSTIPSPVDTTKLPKGVRIGQKALTAQRAYR
jgi:hypothetical protein